MADIANSFKSGISTGIGMIKSYVLPMVVGAIVIAIICGIFPAAKKIFA